MFLLPSEPQSIFQLIRNIYHVFIKSFISVLPLMILMCIAITILSFFANSATFHLQSGIFNLSNKSIVIFDLICFFVVFIIYGAIYFRTYNIIYDRPASFWSALYIGIKKVIPVLIAAIITLFVLALIVLAICVPFFIALHFMTMNLPTIWPFQQILAGPRIEIFALITIVLAYFFAAVLLLFYFALIVVDNLNPFVAFTRSCYLVWGHWWHAASIVGILYFIFPPLLFLLQWYFVYYLPAPHLTALNTWIAAISVQNLVSLFYVPIYISAVLVMLHDLKIRKHVAVP